MVASKSLLTLAPGNVFRGRYRVVRSIKAGGQGAVYEVKDETTNRPRALKVMLPSLVEDPDMRARFALEARVTGDIESDHLVRTSDVGIDEASGSPFMVMDLLRGEDLQTAVDARGALPFAEALEYLAQAGRVLDKTHAANIVHRDIKPDNLFVTRRDDGSPCIKILDFGIAKVIAQAAAKKTRALGTPLYMAPEQVRGDGQIGARADLYSLAYVAYTLLTGEAYWAEEAASDPSLVGLLMKILAGAEEPATRRAVRRRGARLPPAFDAWFQRATAVNPEQRFESAGAQVGALAQILGSVEAARGAVATPAGPPPAAAPYQAAMTGPVAAPNQAATPAQGGPPWQNPAGAPNPYYQHSAGPATSAPAYGAQPQPYPAAPTAPPWAPPPQFVPGSAAPPQPKSGAPAGILVVGAGLFAALVVLVLVLALRSPSAESSPSAPLPASSSGCGAAIACVPTVVADATHADATALMPLVKGLAKQVDPSAKLISVTTSYAQKDGSTNLKENHPIVYMFTIAKGGALGVTVQERLTSASLVPTGGVYGSPVPDPTCPMKRVLAAGALGGVPTNGFVTAHYRQDPGAPAPSWMVYANGVIVEVNDATCAR